MRLGALLYPRSRVLRQHSAIPYVALVVCSYLSLPSINPHMNTALSIMSNVNRSSTKTVPLVCRTVALVARLI